jgi:PAS domain S-box-containing protein
MAIKLLLDPKGARKMGSISLYPGKFISETIVNGFFTVDSKWTVKYWNRAAEKLLGVLAKDIVGKNLWAEFAAIIPVHFYEVYDKAFSQDLPVHFEEYWGEMDAWFDVITYHCGDTLSVSFKSSKQSICPDDLRDPVQQMKIKTQLYQFVTEVTNDSLWEWDLQTGEIFWIDGGHKRLFGYQIENALIPQSFWESCLHPEDRSRVISKLNNTLSEGSGFVWEDEYRFKKFEGGYAYVHDRGHIIYDEDNKPSRMIGATQDITSRKLTEIKLLESEQKLALIARQTANALIITDADEKITWVNSAFTRMTEYEPEEVLGRTPGSFLQGKETDPSTIQYLDQKIKNKLPFDCDIINYSKSGRKYWMHVHGQPLLDKNGKFEQFFSIRTDITEKVLLELKLAEERQTRQREITDAVLTAQENERAEIGKEMHDNLGQILSVAKLYLQMAKTHDENKDAYLDKSCSYIENVIEEIRRISKTLIMPALHIIGMINSIKNLIADLTATQPMKIEFHDEGIDEEELSEKIQMTILRIVQEQLNNILKHAKGTQAVICLKRQENQIILLISDNGRGCDVQKQNNGVGLINIRSRVELFHGTVDILSKPGYGYELKVVLPRQTEPDHPMKAA